MQNLKRKQQNEQFAQASNDAEYSMAAKAGSVVAGIGSFAMSSMASAAVDTTTITTAITDAATAVGVIGAAVVLVVLGIKTYKWVTRSL